MCVYITLGKIPDEAAAMQIAVAQGVCVNIIKYVSDFFTN